MNFCPEIFDNEIIFDFFLEQVSCFDQRFSFEIQTSIHGLWASLPLWKPVYWRLSRLRSRALSKYSQRKFYSLFRGKCRRRVFDFRRWVVKNCRDDHSKRELLPEEIALRDDQWLAVLFWRLKDNLAVTCSLRSYTRLLSLNTVEKLLNKQIVVCENFNKPGSQMFYES